jgi:hypothetical protein
VIPLIVMSCSVIVIRFIVMSLVVICLVVIHLFVILLIVLIITLHNRHFPIEQYKNI